MTAQQLKNAILQMAVQGKLVPQDPNDEPASVFVDQIRKEQERLIKEKIIKKEKFTSAIEDYDEQLPSGWCYVKVGELTSLVTKQTGFDYSKRIKPNLSGIKLDGMIPMIQTKNFKGKDFSFETDYYIPLSIAEEFPKIMLDSKCMLLSIVGSIGNIGIYEKKNIAMIGGAICKVKLLSEQLYDYLFYFFQSPYGQKEIQKNMKATAQVTITVQDVREIVVKMPPLAEQKRIVKKIEELLPYIDKYGTVETKLSALNTTFPEALKKSILQEAVQGKLVPQDPNDEPASVLLERIRAEKQALIKAGKIKKDKHESVIVTRDKIPYEIINGKERCIADEVPFELPEGWALIRLNDIGIYRKGPFGSSLTKSMFVPKGADTVKVYEQKNAIKKDHTLGDYYITRQYYEDKMQGFTVSAGDIIVSCAGTIGETYVMPDNIELGIINQALMRMTIFAPIDIDYFLMYFDYVLKNSARESSKGSAIKNIPPFEIFKQLLLPLPPLAEQKRIVSKIEEIMPIISTI